MTMPISEMPLATWRFLSTGPAQGAWNMAVDEAILEATGRGKVSPTLRVYAWEPACLSLGYAQPFSDVDIPRLAAHGWDVVRRPTGGRAILHTDELTYSVMGPANEPRLAGGVLESYRRLSQALLAALHALGIPAEAQPKAQATTSASGPVCFERPSDYEITVGGKKLVGSAQARRKEGVLQHGSLPLTGDLTRITEALVFPEQAARSEAAEHLLARATTAETVLGQQVSWEKVAQVLADAFQATLNLKLIPGELSPSEHLRASELLSEKYQNFTWTERI